MSDNQIQYQIDFIYKYLSVAFLSRGFFKRIFLAISWALKVKIHVFYGRRMNVCTTAYMNTIKWCFMVLNKWEVEKKLDSNKLKKCVVFSLVFSHGRGRRCSINGYKEKQCYPCSASVWSVLDEFVRPESGTERY